jgi:hypothetical protein
VPHPAGRTDEATAALEQALASWELERNLAMQVRDRLAALREARV